jgi:hypothetical protein
MRKRLSVKPPLVLGKCRAALLMSGDQTARGHTGSGHDQRNCGLVVAALTNGFLPYCLYEPGKAADHGS